MRWTQEMDDYLKEIAPGRFACEIQRLIKARFNVEPTISAIQAKKKRLNVKSGVHTTKGQFKKGHISERKGKTWDEIGISKEAQARMRKTTFKKGNVPKNGKAIPVGTEREDRDGYVLVKTKEASSHPGNNGCWESKSKLMWQKYHGTKLPDGYIVLFANKDKHDFSEDNLVEVSRSIALQLNNNKELDYYDKDSLLACIAIAKIRSKVYDLKKHEKKCPVCGAIFKPEYPHQRRCRKCIDAGITVK